MYNWLHRLFYIGYGFLCLSYVNGLCIYFQFKYWCTVYNFRLGIRLSTSACPKSYPLFSVFISIPSLLFFSKRVNVFETDCRMCVYQSIESISAITQHHTTYWDWYIGMFLWYQCAVLMQIRYRRNNRQSRSHLSVLLFTHYGDNLTHAVQDFVIW